jgi:hypothetical protein
MTPGTGHTTLGKRLSNSTDSKIAALTAVMTSAVSIISALSDATAKLVGPATPDTPTSDDNTNHSNPALARQAQCPMKQQMNDPALASFLLSRQCGLLSTPDILSQTFVQVKKTPIVRLHWN